MEKQILSSCARVPSEESIPGPKRGGHGGHDPTEAGTVGAKD